MWIMQEVFGLERERMLCEPNEKEGRSILAEVMVGGNFGHYDERIRKVGRGKWVEVFAKIQHSMHLLKRYPSEALWMPVWMVYHFIWKRTFSVRQMGRSYFLELCHGEKRCITMNFENKIKGLKYNILQ